MTHFWQWEGRALLRLTAVHVTGHMTQHCGKGQGSTLCPQGTTSNASTLGKPPVEVTTGCCLKYNCVPVPVRARVGRSIPKLNITLQATS